MKTIARKNSINIFKKNINSVFIFGLLIVVSIIFSIGSEFFLSLGTLKILMISISTIGIVCIGQTFLLIAGDFDISVGSVVGFSSVLLAKMINLFEITDVWKSILVIILTLTAGAVIGFINGLLVTKTKINALITTIAMLSIVIGLALLISNSLPISLNAPFFIAIGSGTIFGFIPYTLVILLFLYLVSYLLLKRTVFGRYVYAVGANEEAAKLAGIKAGRIKILLFTATSSLAALAGIFLASKTLSALASYGKPYPLITIAACVLGGCRIRGGVGGKGGALGSLLAIIFLMVIRNGLVLIDQPQAIQDILTGIILLLAVFFSEKK